MTCLQNSIYRNSDMNGMKDAERISLDRIRRDVIQGALPFGQAAMRVWLKGLNNSFRLDK